VNYKKLKTIEGLPIAISTVPIFIQLLRNSRRKEYPGYSTAIFNSCLISTGVH